MLNAFNLSSDVSTLDSCDSFDINRGMSNQSFQLYAANHLVREVPARVDHVPPHLSIFDSDSSADVSSQFDINEGFSSNESFQKALRNVPRSEIPVRVERGRRSKRRSAFLPQPSPHEQEIETMRGNDRHNDNDNDFFAVASSSSPLDASSSGVATRARKLSMSSSVTPVPVPVSYTLRTNKRRNVQTSPVTCTTAAIPTVRRSKRIQEKPSKCSLNMNESGYIPNPVIVGGARDYKTLKEMDDLRRKKAAKYSGG